MNYIIRNTCIALLVVNVLSSEGSAKEASFSDDIVQGKILAFDRKKGNCLACHYIEGGTLMGNTGPALIAMKQRFPDRKKLFAQLKDARINNAQTIMPPFGDHGILTDHEINNIVDWLYTL